MSKYSARGDDCPHHTKNLLGFKAILTTSEVFRWAPPKKRRKGNGRYWTRTSDLFLVMEAR